MKKLLSAVSLMIAIIGVTAMPDTIATAHADPIIFAPDWPNIGAKLNERYALPWHKAGHAVRSLALQKSRTIPI
jgi:hypothetical protein